MAKKRYSYIVFSGKPYTFVNKTTKKYDVKSDVESISLAMGETQIVTISGDDASKVSASSFSFAPEGIASVTDNGDGTFTIASVSAGTTLIKITIPTEDAEVYEDTTITIPVTITKKDQSITVDRTSGTMVVGTTEQSLFVVDGVQTTLTATPSSSDITVKIADNNIVLVTATKAGSYTIKLVAEANDTYNEFEQVVNVTVTKENQEINVTDPDTSLVIDGATTITLSGAQKDNATITVTPTDGVTLSTEGDVTTLTATKAGSYVVSVSADATDEFEAFSKTINITVEKKDAVAPVINEGDTTINTATTIELVNGDVKTYTITLPEGVTCTATPSGSVSATIEGNTLTVTCVGEIGETGSVVIKAVDNDTYKNFDDVTMNFTTVEKVVDPLYFYYGLSTAFMVVPQSSEEITNGATSKEGFTGKVGDITSNKINVNTTDSYWTFKVESGSPYRTRWICVPSGYKITAYEDEKLTTVYDDQAYANNGVDDYTISTTFDEGTLQWTSQAAYLPEPLYIKITKE